MNFRLIFRSRRTCFTAALGPLYSADNGILYLSSRQAQRFRRLTFPRRNRLLVVRVAVGSGSPLGSVDPPR
ncbi:MAG: hypothetical protein C0483_18365 [Pirellula sp.]|nr:hypothetical protein [Pirellula sp.]